jgi:hypothetical protein
MSREVQRGITSLELEEALTRSRCYLRVDMDVDPPVSTYGADDPSFIEALGSLSLGKLEGGVATDVRKEEANLQNAGQQKAREEAKQYGPLVHNLPMILLSFALSNVM